MKNMILKSFMLMALSLVLMQGAFAQEVDDGSAVILPVEAQACDLPSAPPAIPEAPTKEDLLKAQGNVKNFQAAMIVYRDCINEDADSAELTDGNRTAINEAHNYSVEMEERVAAMFNEAVRAYKANLAKG
jgi:hypothetical protein